MSNRPVNWISVICLSLFGIAFLAVASRAAQAQEPEKLSPEVHQLKEKLQQLEQTVQELKTRLAGLEQPRLTTAQPTTPHPAESIVTNANSKQEDKKGENTFQVYGFAMLDMGYQFKQNQETGLT